jgi:hypothetical protein
VSYYMHVQIGIVAILVGLGVLVVVIRRMIER